MLSGKGLEALMTVVEKHADAAELGRHVTVCRQRMDCISPAGALWPEVVQSVLKHANEKSWLRDLLEELFEGANIGLTLRKACVRAIDEWDAVCQEGEPYAPSGRREQALILFNKAPFVDRGTMRPLIDEIVTLTGRRVLLVRGNAATGKSYLNYFVRHIVEAAPGIRMATIRLDELDADLVHAHDLMTSLVVSMGLRPDPAWDQVAQEPRLSEKYVRWLIGQLTTTNIARWVIVIDHINHAKVAPGAVEFVSRLVMAVARGDLPGTSLIAVSLPPEMGFSSVSDEIIQQSLAPLTRSDVRAHCEALSRAFGRDPAPGDLDAMEAFVVKKLKFPLDLNGMQTVRRRVAQLHDRIPQVPA